MSAETKEKWDYRDGEQIVGVVLKSVREDGAVQYIVRGDSEMREAVYRIASAHQLTAASEGVGVTEAMVDAFLSAYAKCELYNGWTFTHRMGVRAGIRAALADSPAPLANGGGEVARG